MKKLIGRIEPVMHLQGHLDSVPGGVYAPEDETVVSYIVRALDGTEIPSDLVEEESTASLKILQILEMLPSLTDEERKNIEAEVDRLLNETDPAELGNLAGHSIVNKIRLAQTYRDDVISAIEAKGISAADKQPFRTVADLVEQIIRQAKTVTPTTEEQVIVPDEGVYGLESVTVEPAPLQEKSIEPTAAEQIVKPDEGFVGMSQVTVEAPYLSELTVWSTDEEQVFTPDEGCLGFSRVIVEAVDDSGGDTGGDGGGTGAENQFASAENVQFGTEIVYEEKPTGYTIFDELGKLPNPPGAEPYYHVFHYDGDRYDLIETSVPYHSTNGTARYLAPESRPYHLITYRYHTSEAEKGWQKASDYPEFDNSSYSISQKYYANYDIMYNGTVVQAAGNMTTEVKLVETKQPIAVDETYTISGSTMNDLGNVIQELTGSNATTPSGMISALETYIANQNTETTE